MSRTISLPGLAAAGFQWRPSDFCFPTPLREIFNRDADLHVDAGCGDGLFLVEMARRHPECNFLGIERLLGRVRKTCDRAARAALTNLRVLRLETSYAVRYLLPPASVSVFHFSFPDPWPKRRHNERRLFQPLFADAVWSSLRQNGELRISTDHLEYFEQMTTIAGSKFQPLPWHPGPDYPRTDFERRYAARNLPIYRARFVKTSPVT